MSTQAKASTKINKSPFLNRLLVLLLCLYFIVTIGLLAVRYCLPSHINSFRGQIENKLSSQLDLDVKLSNIDLKWQGWRPILTLDNVTVSDHESRLLNIPSIKANLNWASLFGSKTGFVSLQVIGMDLTITRKPDGDLDILGQNISLTGDELIDLPWLNTLLQQPFISFTDTTLRWHDLLRNAPELLLQDLDLELQHDYDNNINLRLQASAPQVATTNLQLRLSVANTFSIPAIDLNTSRAWLVLSGFNFDDWAAWVDKPPQVESAAVDLQLWLGSKNQVPYLTAMVKASQLGLGTDFANSGWADEINLWADVSLAQINKLNILKPDIKPSSFNNIGFDLVVAGTYLNFTDIFANAIVLDTVKANGLITSLENLQINFNDLKVANPDIQAQASGSWRADGPAGYADISGLVSHANLATLYQYLPLEVDADARQWLEQGLLSAQIENAQWHLRGDLYEFPFGQHPEAGDFKIAGNYHSGRVEFVPDAKPADKWPQIYAMQGQAQLHRASLSLTAEQALISPVANQTINLSNVQAEIADIERNAVLTVNGLSKANGATYMSLINNTPLSYMLNNIFAEAQAQGDWVVPLSLEVPLLNSIDTKVAGSVNFSDAAMRFLPQAPLINSLSGKISFTEHGISINKPVTGQLLGGPVNITGALGGVKAKGLGLSGQMTAAAIGQFVAVKGMHYIDGQLSYSGNLKQVQDHYQLELNSDTSAIAINLPAPFSKPAGEKRNLQVLWSDEDRINERINIKYGDVVNFDLYHQKNSQQGPYFHIAAIGVQQLAQAANTSGLSVYISYPLIDLDYWDNLLDEFSEPSSDRPTSSARELWPALSLLSVQADQLRLLGTRLDQAVLRLHQKTDTDWSLNIRSEQTSGTVKWQYINGKVSGIAQANFDQLSIGDDPADGNSLLPEPKEVDRTIDDNLDIPALVLAANNLRVYGRSYGPLNLEGTRDGRHKLWQLDRLRLGHKETALLKGTGQWRLTGANRGLQLNADIELSDLGAWLEDAGWHNIITGGEGLIKGKFEWLDLPWNTDKESINGNLHADLKNGRFDKLGSSTAKLLEVLSLQSITRLGKLDQGLGGIGKEGFPFDQLQGNMTINDGNVDIKDYKVIGSIGTILLQGKANIVRRDMDLDAVVVPNLDVSGAALAAGIAINPLVGLGAFITQWLLKEPLAKSMTVRYLVSGSWDDPQVKEVPIKATTTKD